MRIGFTARYVTPPDGPLFEFHTDTERIMIIREWCAEYAAMVVIKDGPVLEIPDEEEARRVVDQYSSGA